MGKVTSREVARAAGVSQSLVSRTFTGKGSIAPETRARILKAAKDLGWQHNAIAASMVTSDAPLVAVVTARLHFDWRAQVLSQLLAAFDASGVVPLLFYADTDVMVPRLLADTGRWQTRSVVVTAGYVDAQTAAGVIRSGRFLAALNRPAPHPRACAIGTDNAGAGAVATRLLVRAGRRRLLMLGGLAAARRWLACAPGHRADGVFAANDLLAIGFIDGLRAAGVTVPDDVAVIGFDNLPAAAWAPYRLTTFAQPIRHIVAGVLDHITAHRKGHETVTGKMQLVPAEPVFRDSLGVLR